MLKKVFIVFIAITMAMFVFAGCDQGTETSEPESSKVSSSSEATPTESNNMGVFEGFKEMPEDFNLQGATIVVSSWSDEEPKEGETDDGDKVYRRRKMAEEKFNFTFEYKHVPGQAYADMFASSSAAGIFFADIVRSPTQYSFPTWIQNGFYAPLDDVLDYESEKYSQQSGLSVWVDGKHYFLTSPMLEPMVVVYNPDMLEREGAPDPLELAQQGKWNWDAMLEIAKLTTKNVGTQNEQFGLKGWFATPLLLSNGVAGVRVGDGELTSGLFEPAALTALNFYRKLKVEEQVVDPADWTIGNQNFINGTVAMAIGERWSFAGLREHMSTFKVVPMPFGPDNTENLIISNNIGVTGFSPLSEVPIEQLVALWVYGSATDYRPDADTFIDQFDSFYENNRSAERPFFDTDESLEYFWEVVTSGTYALGPGIDGQIMWDYIVSNGSPIALGESPATVLATMENEVRAYLESISR